MTEKEETSILIEWNNLHLNILNDDTNESEKERLKVIETTHRELIVKSLINAPKEIRKSHNHLFTN